MQNQDHTISYIRQENILDEKTLEKLLQQQHSSGQSLISILRENDVVNDEQFTRIVAAAGNIEFINLSADMVDPMAALMITYQMANQHNIIPVKKSGNELHVAMSEPLNLAVRDQIELRTGCKVIPFAATPDAIRHVIKYHFNVQNLARQTVASMRLKTDSLKDKPDSTQLEIKSPQVPEAPTAKLFSSIITGAIDAGASDIHIEPGKPDIRTRYRIDGVLSDVIDIPSSVQQELISHIKIRAEMDISERRLPQDGHITLRHNDRSYDLRVSSLPATGGEKVVIRILDKTANKWDLEKIITSSSDNQRLRSLLKNPYGMLLLTGPTGCGKTTTLYSILQLLNIPEKNIVTVEDPVEYSLDGITQVQVRPVAGVTFASTLRSILRQDPDIILVGEIRDLETAEIAISAALTGHLVLSTLHTNDAVGAIWRLINIGIPPYLVASALLGAVAQRLIRTTCSRCRQVYQPSADELKYISDKTYADKKIEFYRGTGCHYCHNTGYHGRKAVYEILHISHKIRGMILDSASSDAVKEQAISGGMKTLHKSGIEEVIKAATTLEELARVVDVRVE